LYRALRIVADLHGEGKIIAEARERFERALMDDLNTPEALAVMWEVLKDDSLAEGDKRETVLLFDKVLGLGFGSNAHRNEVEKLAVVSETELPKAVQALLHEREAARASGDWGKADNLRARIAEAGYDVFDTKAGSEVRRSGVSPEGQ
jgi:cysteinyl-tRNA synthetase